MSLGLDDSRVWVPCGKCFYCRKQRASQWRTRLIHELTYGKHSKCWFLTLTFDEPNLEKYKNNVNVPVRRFLERYRKRYKTSLRHWFVTELGETTARLHLHGVIFSPPPGFTPELLDSLWSYGFTYVGQYVTPRTMSYIVKYMLKPHPLLPWYTSKVFCSPGIGRAYCTSSFARTFHRPTDNYDKWNMFIRNPTGFSSLPRYYRDKIFTPVDLRLSKLSHRLNSSDNKYTIDGLTFRNIEDYEAFLAYRNTMLTRLGLQTPLMPISIQPSNEF